MDVLVRDLLGRRRAHLDDLHVESQRLARERMVPVEDRMRVVHRDDGEGHRTVRGLGLDLGPRLQLELVGQLFPGRADGRFRVLLAVGVLRGDGERRAEPRFLTVERSLEARDDLSVPVEVDERSAAAAALNRRAALVAQRVVQPNHPISLNPHRVTLACRPREDVDATDRDRGALALLAVVAVVFVWSGWSPTDPRAWIL